MQATTSKRAGAGTQSWCFKDKSHTYPATYSAASTSTDAELAPNCTTSGWSSKKVIRNHFCNLFRGAGAGSCLDQCWSPQPAPLQTWWKNPQLSSVWTLHQHPISVQDGGTEALRKTVPLCQKSTENLRCDLMNTYFEYLTMGAQIFSGLLSSSNSKTPVRFIFIIIKFRWNLHSNVASKETSFVFIRKKMWLKLTWNLLWVTACVDSTHSDRKIHPEVTIIKWYRTVTFS